MAQVHNQWESADPGLASALIGLDPEQTHRAGHRQQREQGEDLLKQPLLGQNV